MKIKTKRKICGVIAFIAFFFVLGTAGASDADLIPMKQIVWRSVIGMAVFAAAVWKGGFME